MHYIKAQYYEKMHKSIHKFFITRRAEAEQLPRRLITAVDNGGWLRRLVTAGGPSRRAPRPPALCSNATWWLETARQVGFSSGCFTRGFDTPMKPTKNGCPGKRRCLCLV